MPPRESTGPAHGQSVASPRSVAWVNDHHHHQPQNKLTKASPASAHRPSPTASSERVHLDPRYKRVLQAVRSIDVNGRCASALFEDLPDAEEHPLYYKLIPDPVCLKSLERDPACRKSPLVFAQRFDQMIMNAKFYNKPKSTIYKDAERLHKVFQETMMAEFDLEIDEGELDEDADGAWVRDLRQRGALAHYERVEFQHAQKQAVERMRLAKATKPSAAELEVKRFIQEPLVMKPVKEKSAQRCETREALATAHLDVSGGFAAHDDESCLLCPAFANLVKASQVKIVTPTFRIVEAVTRRTVGKKRAAPAVYSPMPRLRARVIDN